MGGGEKIRRRFLSSANFHSTIICSPKNWMNWDMQPAGWVIWQEAKKRQFFGFLTERCYQCVTCVMLLSDLHFRVHTAVDGGDTPGWASGDQSVSCRGKDSPLVLIEGFQWGILAWTLQLVSTRQWQEEREKRRNNIRYEPFSDMCIWACWSVFYRNHICICKICTPSHGSRGIIWEI